MSRNLIDRDRLINGINSALQSISDEVDKGDRSQYQLYLSTSFVNAVNDILDIMPTVDAVEVVHGEWETYDAYKQTIDGRTFDGWCECSECRTMYPWEFSTYNYCPNCGAKMDGEVKSDGN